MFGPDYAAGCPPGSAIADGLDGIAPFHLSHPELLRPAVMEPLDKILWL
jgi:predicted dithiol-disulfide oxidoreductase (DUF899 family)